MRILPALILAACVALAGCNFRPEAQPRPGDAEDTPAENTPVQEVGSAKVLTIGDVEAVVELRATVAGESRSEQVHVQEMESAVQKLTLVRAKMLPPYPSQLWIAVGMTDTFSYENRPVVIRGIVYRQRDDGEEEPIGQLNSVIGVSAEAIASDPETFGPRATRIDVLADLEELPETMLILVRAKAMLLPESTDLSKLDPADTEAPPADTTTLVSNPIRIDIEPEPAQ